MKKLIILQLIMIINISLFGQELPEITLPSPTAFELTKYGDVPINETSGKVTASIPLYTYQSGNLQLPISLSYAGAGVKIDQLSSWTGINWSLSAGGAITRTVNDRPDEMTSSGYRVLHTQEELNNMNLLNYSQDVEDINELESWDAYDTQVDQFNFSFAGYSGSFYLDENLEPQLANYSTELKIEFIGGVSSSTNQTISITTPDGVEYLFGGATATEQSRTITSNNPDGNMLSPNTAFYLFQISHPFGDTINFFYNEETSSGIDYPIKISESEQYSTGVIGGSDNSNCGSSAPIGYSSDQVHNKVYNGKYLSKITSSRSNIEVHFSSEELPNNIHLKRILNKVEIIDNVNTINKESFEFTYIYTGTLPNISRFFLEKVEFFNYLNNKKYDYTLEYDDPLSLPERFSYSRDFLGYYNGKNNTTNLPKNNHAYLQSISGYTSLADRDTDFNFVTKGSLTKINYPTGGNTEFEYEVPQVLKEETDLILLKVLNDLSEMNPNAYPIPDTDLSDTESFTSVTENGGSSGVFKDQTISVSVNAIATGNINHHYIITIKLTNLTTNTFEDRTMVLAPDIYEYNSNYDFDLIKDNNYKIELILDPDSSSSTSYPVSVNANFEYVKGNILGDGLGIRVKKVIDNPVDNLPIVKRYYYQNIQDIGSLEGVRTMGDISSTFIYNHIYTTCCTDSPTEPHDLFNPYPTQDTHLLITLKSNSINSFFPSSDSQWQYQVVTISYGGDNFENGGTEKRFRYIPAYSPYNFNFNSISEYSSPIFATQTENKDIFNDRLTRETHFKNYNSELFMTNETQYNYAGMTDNYVTNMIIQRVYDVCRYDL